MNTSTTTSPVQPALTAVKDLRTELKKRAGKEGGHLNRLVQQYLATIETTLLQIEPLSNMIHVLNRQTEVAVHGFRALAAMHTPTPVENGGDDGTSETKGL